MKLCTCPRIATARGLLPTGDIDARCPVHRLPDPPPARIMTAAPEPKPAFEGVRYCEECGRQHAAVVLRAGTIKRVHVNRHVIAANRKTGRRDPALTIQTSKGPHRVHEVRIDGPSWMVYSPDKPLSCGAVAWVETLAAICAVK